jgi:hypothetical protein
VLSRVVLLEAAVPLVAATVIAAPIGTAIPRLGPDYHTIMGIGLAVAFGVIGHALAPLAIVPAKRS